MPDFIEWSDELSVGVDEIDNQHKVLVNMINELNTAVHGGWGKEARKEVIDKLIEYTKVHFATEESLMSITAYPKSNNHKEQHGNLISMVKEHIKRYENDANSSSYDLIFFLKSWLVEHIMKDDKILGEYLVKKGSMGKEKKSWFRKLFGT